VKCEDALKEIRECLRRFDEARERNHSEPERYPGQHHAMDAGSSDFFASEIRRLLDEVTP